MKKISLAVLLVTLMTVLSACGGGGGGDTYTNPEVCATWYVDADADGYGTPSLTVVSCTAPAGYVADSGDCDDALAAVNPGAIDVSNGVDDNCDGTIDNAGVVISQIYGGGGSTGATYMHDFIELHNRGKSDVDVTGWSVQYASASGTTWMVTNLSGTIPVGGYMLVQQGSGGADGSALPAADVVDTINMGATGGKVALARNQVAISGCGATGPDIVDFVGYGAATCYETAPTGAPSATTSVIRNGGGCTDTNDNSADFTVDTPAPRNNSNTPLACAL